MIRTGSIVLQSKPRVCLSLLSASVQLIQVQSLLNANQKNKQKKQPQYSGKSSTFNHFEYIPSDYNLVDEIKAQEKKIAKERQVSISGNTPFVPPSATHTLRGLFSDPSYQPDPFDSLRNDSIRKKWIDDSKALAGPFRPAGIDKLGEKPSRALLTEILTALYKNLDDDWYDAQPTVLSTQEDIIVIYFSLENASQAALLAYMNVLSQRNGLLKNL